MYHYLVRIESTSRDTGVRQVNTYLKYASGETETIARLKAEGGAVKIHLNGALSIGVIISRIISEKVDTT